MSNRERDALLRAKTILGKWVEWRDGHDRDDDRLEYSIASGTVDCIGEFLYLTRGERP